MPYIFRPTSRLKSPSEFQAVWKTGKRTSVQLITLISRKNDIGRPRLGISISKKNVPKAVDRNYLKRSIRETFRLRQSHLDAQDIVVVAYKGIAALNRIEQRQRLETLWNLFIKRFETS